MEAIFCQTPRLNIRKIQESDFSDFCSFLIDPETCYLMGREIITNEAEARQTFQWLKDEEERGYALIFRDNQRAIGNLTVSTPHHLSVRNEVAGKSGVTLSFSLDRGYRRKGLMQEALEAVIAKLFHEEHWDYINCGNFDFNHPSAQLQKKLGFVHLYTEEINVDGEHFSCVENILWNPESNNPLHT